MREPEESPLRQGGAREVRAQDADQPGQVLLPSGRPGADVRRDLLVALRVGVGERDVLELVGRLRSCAYGFTVRRNIAYSYLPVELGPGARVEVDVFGRRVPAEVHRDAVLKREQLVSHDAKPVAS